LSDLFTTNASAISINPDLIFWISSPDSGTNTTTVLSASPAMSISDWPTPTVSINIILNPADLRRSVISIVLADIPPRAPLVANDLIYTLGLLNWADILILSPSKEPKLNGDVGSTARMAILLP